MTYEPVTLGKSVWLPWRVFIMPGTTIGDGSVIGANSLVTGTIPPRSLAVGSPAKVIRREPDFPRPLGERDRAALVEEMVREFDRYVEYSGVTLHAASTPRSYTRAGESWRLWWTRDRAALDAIQPARRDTVFTEVALGPEQCAAFRAQGVDWLDLAGYTRSREGTPLTEELAQFLWRYGIRLVRD
jgi:hypothetical protein